MYRIELAPGEVTVFRTIEELATGIRNGFITPRARIYHGASQKWLPIEFHPHYKKALEGPVAQAIEVPVPRPVERPRVEPPSFMSTPAAPATPAAEVAAIVDGPAEPEPADEPPPITTHPVLELPKISYPEITPAEEPVADEPRAARSLRPLQLAVAAVVLAAGAYGMMSAFGPSRGGTAPTPTRPVADRPQLPRVESRTATPAAAPARSPVAAPQPATSGFARALEPGAIVSAPSKIAAAQPPEPPAAAADSSITPAPVELDLTLPSLPEADSLVASARQRADSAAIKRILRAVSGGKDVPQRP